MDGGAALVAVAELGDDDLRVRGLVDGDVDGVEPVGARPGGPSRKWSRSSSRLRSGGMGCGLIGCSTSVGSA
ncbi:hypothetical protein [Pseudonocardia sp.]|uniref:hypothetical protein n=1 Tax=Pseudonocardia sp. TaxID=60912 RepID=UPI003D0FF4F2